jgi:hypothetical protein
MSDNNIINENADAQENAPVAENIQPLKLLQRQQMHL